jgi:hypothetical protein
MKQTVRGWWAKFHASFRSSETILWARLQFVFFAFYTAAQQVDMTAFISDHRLLQCYILVNGFVAELLRRRREDWQRGPK